MAQRDFLLNYHVGKKTGKRYTYGKLFLLFGLVIFAIIGLRNFQSQKSVLSSSITSPLAKDYNFDTSNNSAQVSSDLKNVVESNLSNTKGTYAVDIVNLKTGEEYGKNQNLKFESASLYKLWVMAAVYKKIENGQLINTQTLTEGVVDLNNKFNIDKELAEKTDGTISMTVQDALSQMIEKSDNYSALLLASNIGLSNIQLFLNTNGLINSKVGANGDSPTTTALDVTTFFDKLYNGEFANTTDTSAMLDLLKAQVLNEKLPKYLPESVIVAHKTGELDSFSHDAGIIYADSGTYIISVLSKTDDRESANETIANLSKAVYTYFENIK